MSKKLFIEAIFKFLFGVFLIGVLVFLPAGTFAYPNGWLFMGVLFIPMFMAGIIMIFAKPLLGLYGIVDGAEGSLEALAMQAAIVRFEYICAPYFICGLMEVCTGVLRGLGKSVTSTVISLIGACLLRVVWLLTVFPFKQTLEMIYISYPFLIAFISILWVLVRITFSVKAKAFSFNVGFDRKIAVNFCNCVQALNPPKQRFLYALSIIIGQSMFNYNREKQTTGL